MLTDLMPVKQVQAKGLRRFLCNRVKGMPHAPAVYEAVAQAAAI